jgi:hypothetical protein
VNNFVGKAHHGVSQYQHLKEKNYGKIQVSNPAAFDHRNLYKYKINNQTLKPWSYEFIH